MQTEATFADYLAELATIREQLETIKLRAGQLPPVGTMAAIIERYPNAGDSAQLTASLKSELDRVNTRLLGDAINALAMSGNRAVAECSAIHIPEGFVSPTSVPANAVSVVNSLGYAVPGGQMLVTVAVAGLSLAVPGEAVHRGLLWLGESHRYGRTMAGKPALPTLVRVSSLIENANAARQRDEQAQLQQTTEVQRRQQAEREELERKRNAATATVGDLQAKLAVIEARLKTT